MKRSCINVSKVIYICITYKQTMMLFICKNRNNNSGKSIFKPAYSLSKISVDAIRRVSPDKTAVCFGL